MDDPFKVLEREHRLIARVLDALAIATQRELPRDYYERAVGFLDVYAGAWHHAKEEDVLYRFLREHGMPRDYGPLEIALEEHDYGDAQVAEMRALLDAGDLGALRALLAEHVELLRAHVRTEQELLLPMGRAMLTPDEIAAVGRAFEDVTPPEPSAEHWEDVGRALLVEAEVPA